MLRWRLLLGTLLVAALVALVWLDYRATVPGTYLFPVALVAATLAAGEIHYLVSVRERRPPAWVVYGGTFLVVAATGVPHWMGHPGDVGFGALRWPLTAMAAVVIAALVAEVVRYQPTSGAALNAAVAVFAVAYAGLLLSFIIQLRFLQLTSPPNAAMDSHWGTIALVSLLIVVKMSDIGAYTVGRLIGRHKLAPTLSPGKTIEGVVGGLVFAAGSSLLVFKVLAPVMVTPPSNIASGISWLGPLVYGVVLGVAGVAGDLAESMMKRDAGQKDSSRWMPGFGGGLDLLDSLLLAAPVAYVLWVVGVVGPRAGY